MKTSLRSQKVASNVQQELLPLIQQFLSPKQIGFLAITKIEVSVDLKIADVYVTSLRAPEGFEKKLNNYAKKISYELSHKLILRRPIELRFKEDILAGIPSSNF